MVSWSLRKSQTQLCNLSREVILNHNEKCTFKIISEQKRMAKNIKHTIYFANCTPVFLPKFWSWIWWINNLIEIGNIIIFVAASVAVNFLQSVFIIQPQLLWCILAITFCGNNQRGVAVFSWIRNFIWNYKIEINFYLNV